MGTLTVRENLMFSANLRLPKCISKEEKERKVDETLYELGLQACADSKVGKPEYISPFGRDMTNKMIYNLKGWHSFDARSVRRREEAHEHRHGADHLAQGFVPRRTHHRTRLQHCECCHATSTKVCWAAFNLIESNLTNTVISKYQPLFQDFADR